MSILQQYYTISYRGPQRVKTFLVILPRVARLIIYIYMYHVYDENVGFINRNSRIRMKCVIVCGRSIINSRDFHEFRLNPRVYDTMIVLYFYSFARVVRRRVNKHL